jgi:excisionase family DNA binding protein
VNERLWQPGASEIDGARAQLEMLLSPACVDAIEQLVEERVRQELAARDSRVAERTWLTLEEAGEQLGVSADAVRMRVKRGRLEGKTQGRRVYVSAASVERLSPAA